MRLNTASMVVSFAKKLEGDSAKIYEELTQMEMKNHDVFNGFVKENRRFIVDIDRTYYGVITDAIEGCFSFDLDTEHYIFPSSSGDSPVKYALDIEETIKKFYLEAAECSKGLMADVPLLFAHIAKKRGRRITTLRSIY